MPTIAEAKGTIFNHFGTFWDAQIVARSINTEPYFVVYENVDFDGEKDIKNWPQPHAEIEIQHLPSGIASLGDEGNRLFRREGLVLVRVKTLKGNKDALGGTVLNDLLTQVAMDAFDGKHLTGNIWFQDVFPVEEGPDDNGQFFVTTVTAEVQYDEIK